MNRHILTSFLLIIGILSAHCGNLFAAVHLPLAQSNKMAAQFAKLKQQALDFSLDTNAIPAGVYIRGQDAYEECAVPISFKPMATPTSPRTKSPELHDISDSETNNTDESSEITQSRSATPPASPRSQSPVRTVAEDEYFDAQEGVDIDIYHDAQEEQDTDFHNAQEYVDEIIGSNDPYFNKEYRIKYLQWIALHAPYFTAQEAQELEFIVSTLLDEKIVLTLEDIERMMINILKKTTHAGSIMRVLLQKEYLYKLRVMKLNDKTYQEWHRVLERAEARYNMHPTENNALIVEKIKGKIALVPTSPRMIITQPQAHVTPLPQSYAAPAERSVYNPIRYVVAAKELTFLVAAGAEHGLRNRGNTWIAKPFSWLAWATQ